MSKSSFTPDALSARGDESYNIALAAKGELGKALLTFAADEYAAAITLDPKNPAYLERHAKAHFALSLYNQKKQQPEEAKQNLALAIHSLAKAAELDPENTTYRDYQASAQKQLDNINLTQQANAPKPENAINRIIADGKKATHQPSPSSSNQR